MKEVCLLKYLILGQVAIIYGRKHEQTLLNSMQIFFYLMVNVLHCQRIVLT